MRTNFEKKYDVRWFENFDTHHWCLKFHGYSIHVSRIETEDSTFLIKIRDDETERMKFRVTGELMEAKIKAEKRLGNIFAADHGVYT